MCDSTVPSSVSQDSHFQASQLQRSPEVDFAALCLINKVPSRLHGSYEALKYGTSLDGLSDFTGGVAECVSLRADPTTCGRLLAKLLNLTSIVTAVVTGHNHGQSKIQPEKLANGIVMGVNYRIYAIEKVPVIVFTTYIDIRKCICRSTLTIVFYTPNACAHLPLHFLPSLTLAG